MSIGILETGRTPAHLVDQHGRYDAMMRRMLGPGFSATTYDVMSGDLPPRAEAHEAYLITGSPAGVYDRIPWIDHLRQFLRGLDGRAKLVGICFGHQIMADSYGGRVEKSHKGWGLGLHRYGVSARAPWMDDAVSVSIPVSHQDQVISTPVEADVLGGSDFTPFGILSYPARRAISFQCHPEFDAGYAAELVELRRAGLPDPAHADRARASLLEAGDGARVAGWIRDFLKQD